MSMADVLVDTNVVSYVMKRDSRGLLYRSHLERNKLFVAFITVAELYKWAVRHNWSAQRIEKLRRDLRRYSIVAFDDALAWQWAHVASMPGRPMEPADAWVAATALRYNLPLVTHNRRHFEHIPNLQIISAAPTP
jgi:predicted nucleic acid-binding protein